jgi:hypothetical protein
VQEPAAAIFEEPERRDRNHALRREEDQSLEPGRGLSEANLAPQRATLADEKMSAINGDGGTPPVDDEDTEPIDGKGGKSGIM